MMTSLNREENTESIVGREPDDPGDEVIAEITGNELDEPKDIESQRVTGREPDDPGDEVIAEIIGNELDEPKDIESQRVTGRELDDPGDEAIAEITGHELDDQEDEESGGATGDDLNGPGVQQDETFGSNELNDSKDEESKTYKEENNKSESVKRKFRVNRRWFLFFVTGMCLLAGGSYYFSHHKNGEQIISRNNIFPIPHDKSIMFESFILPVKKKQGYTYFSLNLLLELSNIELKGEIIEKKDQLRGIIYDILEQEIHRVKDADSLEKLKALIIKRANTALTSGEVLEVIITDFLLV